MVITLGLRSQDLFVFAEGHRQIGIFSSVSHIDVHLGLITRIIEAVAVPEISPPTELDLVYESIDSR